LKKKFIIEPVLVTLNLIKGGRKNEESGS